LSEDKFFVLALDIGGTRLRTALADSTGKIVNQTVEATHPEQGLESGLERIKEAIRKAASKINFDKIRGIAIGAAGPVDPQAGVILTPPNLPTWENLPLRERLEEEFGLPVWVENDADLAALGERRFGAGKGFNHLIYITVSTGIGGGIITNGQLLHGSKGSAAEIGHMVIDPQGPVCGCGGRGHLEALASGTAIARMAVERISHGQTSDISNLVGDNLSQVTAVTVAQAAQDGDPLAKQVMREAGTSLGLAVVSLVHLFDPEVIIIGGGVSNAGELILEPVREVIAERAMPDFKKRAKIVRSALGDDSGILGAAALALDKPVSQV